MKRQLLLLGLLIFAVIMRLEESRDPHDVQKSAPEVVHKLHLSPVTVQEVSVKDAAKEAVSENHEVIPRKLKVKTRTHRGLPRSMVLALDVKAIPVSSYEASFGEKLLEKNGFVFFRSTRHPGAALTAYDQRRDTFHPITSTLRVKNVDSERRESNQRILPEHHYLSELQLQYLESTPERLLADYKKLEAEGVTVSLEVVPALYQTR